eukprot:2619932-Rhodomonas_salina.2
MCWLSVSKSVSMCHYVPGTRYICTRVPDGFGGARAHTRCIVRYTKVPRNSTPRYQVPVVGVPVAYPGTR